MCVAIPNPKAVFAHRRACSDDVQRAGLQAREQLVEVVVPGGRSRDRVAALVVLLELIHGDVEELLDRARRVDHTILGHLEHLRFREVDRLRHVVGFGEGEVGDLAGGVDQPSQQRRVHHDAGVVLGTGDRRCGVLQIVQSCDAAHLVEQAVTTQLVGDGDHVDRS
jgi:hypothetical protein